jgi:dipeptidyl aminopeptidase/acylaminoacyl peptidase
MFDPFMPVKNVSKDYPPTLLIHGDKDTDVPYEQSVMMAEEFKRHGVPFEFVTIPDSGHGFAGGEKDLVSRAYDDSFAFVERYMK